MTSNPLYEGDRMKKMIAVMAVVLLPVVLIARDANQMKYQEVFANQFVTGATTGSVYDVSAYKGNAAFVFATGASAVTNYTASIVLQHSTATNGTFSAVTNIAGTAVSKTIAGAGSATAAAVTAVPCDLARLHKYVRVVATQANATNEVAVILVAPYKSE